MSGSAEADSQVRRKIGVVCVAIAVATVAACSAGSGEGLSVSGRPLGEGGDQPLAPTLASLQVNIFDTNCTICHSGAAAPLGLRLDAQNSFTNLVGTASRQEPGTLRVSPGNPDRSYLIQKLDGTANTGQQMPLGGPPLTQTSIAFVRQWIIDGALPADSQPPGTAPRIVGLTPDPGSTIAALPVQLTAMFDQDIDASTINAMTFELQRSGGDGRFSDGNEQNIVASAIGLSTVNPRLALFDLTGVIAADDRYQLTLRGSGANIVLGVNGLALDGEFDGALPSGDNDEGGDFVAEFDLQRLQPTLQSIQDNVFTPTCSVSGCHSGPAGPALPNGMDLTSAQASFASLVGVPGIQAPATLRVAPNDAGSSYLVQKIEGTAISGARMPLGGAALDQSVITAIRNWIDQGANP